MASVGWNMLSTRYKKGSAGVQKKFLQSKAKQPSCQKKMESFKKWSRLG
jgi:hypothetical protein